MALLITQNKKCFLDFQFTIFVEFARIMILKIFFVLTAGLNIYI